MVRMPGFPARPGRTNRGSRALQVLGSALANMQTGESLYTNSRSLTSFGMSAFCFFPQAVKPDSFATIYRHD
jgi:hypothetical protein